MMATALLEMVTLLSNVCVPSFRKRVLYRKI
jgi:hypothetical protein